MPTRQEIPGFTPPAEGIRGGLETIAEKLLRERTLGDTPFTGSDFDKFAKCMIQLSPSIKIKYDSGRYLNSDIICRSVLPDVGYNGVGGVITDENNEPSVGVAISKIPFSGGEVLTSIMISGATREEKPVIVDHYSSETKASVRHSGLERVSNIPDVPMQDVLGYCRSAFNIYKAGKKQ